ncbi:MAG TPA: peptidase S10 [Thermoanaerobaculia bacterium]|nr:peptidase S10 [Thermoanaerobaculia bacterium]
MVNRSTLLIALILTLAVVPASAQEPAAAKPAAAREKPAAPAPEERTAVTRHHVVADDGRRIDYTATAGTLLLKKEDGTPRASIFYIAYTRDGESDRTARPVTFSFNGGPGSSSVWLHLGVLGPRRVIMGDAGALPGPPWRVGANEQTLLDVSDLVFIDPVSTGYSRAVPEEEAKSFHGLEEDVEAVGEFIRLWVTRNQRWGSPKYLIGESYGTTRAAALSDHLQGRHGMYLNGVMLISSILDFQTARFETGNDLPYVLFLPTYTATAAYHGKLPTDLQQRELRETLAEVEEFALGEYATALMKGNDLPAAESARIAERVSRYTGLSREYVERSNLRIRIDRFVKELLRDRRLTAGRLDSRFTGRDLDAAGERYEYDPSYAAIQGSYTGALLDYVRGDLRFESDLPYEILTGRVRPWSYGNFENRYVNVAEHLRRAMAQNPGLRVFVASGYYDLATPYFATDYTIDHLGYEPDYEDRVTTEYYEAGHMMYVHLPSLGKLGEDLERFILALP